MRAAFIVLLSVIAGTFCQEAHYQSPHQAAILSDTRYLAGDGTFGAAYSQEDGVMFKEESDVNGDRRGSYSYVDPTGHRRTVTYTAGKNGFQVREIHTRAKIATGDHIPSAPPQVPPQPEYVPLPQYNSPDYQAPSSPLAPSSQQYPQRYQPDYEPQSVVYQPQPQLQYQYRPQPQPLPQPQPQPQPHPQPQPQPQPQPRYHHPPELQAIPSYTASNAHYQPQPRPSPQYNTITTPASRNFYPPGKLDFNRTPDGFSYSFSKS